MLLRFTNATSDNYSGNIYAFAIDPGATSDVPIAPTYTMAIAAPPPLPSPQADVPWQAIPGEIHVWCAIDDGAGGYAAVTDITVSGGADLHRIRLQGTSGAYHFQYLA